MSSKLKKENVTSLTKVPNSPNEKILPKIITIDKDNVNLVHCTLSTYSSNMLKRIAIPLKNNFQDNQNLAVSFHPSWRCNEPSDDVDDSKTTGLPKDTTTDIPDRINSLSGYVRCYVEDLCYWKIIKI